MTSTVRFNTFAENIHSELIRYDDKRNCVILARISHFDCLFILLFRHIAICVIILWIFCVKHAPSKTT